MKSNLQNFYNIRTNPIFFHRYSSSLEFRSSILARKQGKQFLSKKKHEESGSNNNNTTSAPSTLEYKETQQNDSSTSVDVDEKWEKRKKSIMNHIKAKEVILAMKKLNQHLTERPVITKREAQYLLLWTYMKHYTKHIKDYSKEDPKKINARITMLHLVHKILDKHGGDLKNKEKKIIIKAMVKMNFHQTATLLANEFRIEAPSLSSRFIESSIEFQLLRMGDLLKRKDEAEYDERVRFKPDSWQRELINIVDKGGSALIVAPTSAGKRCGLLAEKKPLIYLPKARHSFPITA